VTGPVRVKGVPPCPNAVLLLWLKEELTAILVAFPLPPVLSTEDNRRAWARWQERLTIRITLPEPLPPLRMLVMWDNLTGHLPPSMVRGLFAQGIMPLSMPHDGSWRNMAEST
jgi:hypothetical protein